MPTCATQQKLAETAPIYNLILPVPATDFRDFLDEVDKLPWFAPKIIEEMEKVLAYNCCRIILMRKRRREALGKAA